MTTHWRPWRHASALVAVAAVSLATTGDAQTVLRMRGRTLVLGGGPVAAAVQLEAVYGFRGLDFVGQKTFAARSNDRGEWSALGLTSGMWLLAAHGPEHLPQVIVLPVQFTQKNPASAVGAQLPWEVGFDLVPRAAHPGLAAAADAALAGRRHEVAGHLAATFESGDPDALVSAGEIALYARDAGLARGMFERALAAAPTSGRARLGLASAALLDGAWERAAKELWTARETGASPHVVRAIGAAISDLQRITTYRAPGGR